MSKGKLSPDQGIRLKRFEAFLKWFEKCEGRERAEGQTFFIQLLRAFGVEDPTSAGVKFEEPVKKKSTGSTGFADMVWGKRVLIELKERGTDLKRHYQQVADYWFSLTPKPKYVCLCNFDEFWIYDFDVQMNDPVHYFRTSNLVEDYPALGFLFESLEEPVFNNNHVEVTERAAEKIGLLYQSLVRRKLSPERAQRFVLQLVVAMFSEDVGLIPKNTVLKILKEAVNDNDRRVIENELTALFGAMATRADKSKPKNYSTIPYFNGGLFDSYEPVELTNKEIVGLYEACKEDWSKVRPSIFGSIFEATVDEKKRHAHGIHYTSELDIMKIVNPTIIRPFREKIDSSGNNSTKLKKILKELQTFKVLDPACGSGNFLYLAFRELRRIEYEIRSIIGENPSLISTSSVSLHNFYGIDTNKFGLELAKVALSIGKKLSADEFGYREVILPFDNLDDHFLAGDALFSDWPSVDAIVGNPPFLGKKVVRLELGDDYVERVRSRFGDMTENADYCSYWFVLADKNPAKFCGLVGTNSISQGFSREATLDRILENGGVIHDAITTQEWSGDAAVHVSIVNWHKADQQVEDYVLNGVKVKNINSSLKSEFDVTKAHRLVSNANVAFNGTQINGQGFIISDELRTEFLKKRPKNSEVIRPYVDARILTNASDFSELPYVIDFGSLEIEKASQYREPFKHVEENVKPERLSNREKVLREKWWRYKRSNESMRVAMRGKEQIFCFPRHSKWFIPVIVSGACVPFDSTTAICSSDLYVLGVLTSKFHRDWVAAQASTIKGDTRYTNTTCFETFPFLWEPSEKMRNLVRDVMMKLDAFRRSVMKDQECGITKLYNDFFHEPTSQLVKLHRELDEAVSKVYGWKFDPNRNYNEMLFRLNGELWENSNGSRRT